jgi:tripartite-type tricarboxylate transporter receptor subunit TctC
MTRLVLMLLTACFWASAAHAQTADARWPERPIRFIVPFTAGSSSDTVARLVTQKLGERLVSSWSSRPRRRRRQHRHRPGRTRPSLTAIVRSACQHQHTCRAASATTISYDPVKDFAPVSMLGSSPFCAGALPSAVPAQTVQDLIALAKARPRAQLPRPPGR